MTITKLIENLNEYRKNYGDLPITCNGKEFFIFLIKEDHFDIEENLDHIDIEENLDHIDDNN